MSEEKNMLLPESGYAEKHPGKMLTRNHQGMPW